MIYSAETLTLQDGREINIRSVEPEDAAGMLQYMKIMLGETPFLLRTPEEFNYTPEEEARILAGRKNDPRSLMLVAEIEGQIIASADVCSHGAKSRVQHRAELGISVRKDYWHLGIGSVLIERLISFAKRSLVSSLMVNFLCRIDPIKTAQSGINSNCVIVFFQLSVNLSDKIEQDPHILFFLTIDNVNVANLDPFDKATHKL